MFVFRPHLHHIYLVRIQGWENRVKRQFHGDGTVNSKADGFFLDILDPEGAISIFIWTFLGDFILPYKKGPYEVVGISHRLQDICGILVTSHFLNLQVSQ